MRGPQTASIRVWCTLLAAILVMALCPASARPSGQGPLVLTGAADIGTLANHLDYALDPGWQRTVADFVGPSALEMLPLHGAKPDFGYTSARIWLRLKLVNGTADLEDWRFVVHVSFLQQLAVYLIGADGAISTLVDLTENSPFDARPIDYAQVAAPFTLGPSKNATLVVAYHSLGAARHTMSVQTPDSFAEMARVSTAKNFAFYGMALVMIALGTLALITLRQAVFAAYVGYLLSIFIYIGHADGAAFQYLWPDHPQFNAMAASLTGSGVMVFGGLFAMTFLQTARHHPVMHRILQVVVGSVLALDIALWAVDPKLLNRLLVYMILVSVLTFLTAGLVAARTRFREVRFYVLAWGASLIPASLFTARFAFGMEPSMITPYDAIRLALLLDGLMMGLAIFDRYNHLRQSAMDETLAHARRNLALSQRLATLEMSYEEVTQNARRRAESMKDTVHDLRQPMQALRLSLRQILIARADGAADSSHVEAALGYMESLVAERLAADADADVPGQASSSRARGGTLEEPRNASAEPGLHDVLRGVADMFAAEAAAKGLGLQLVLAAPDAAVNAYPLMRIVANLVSNAIKYTPHGRILIGLRRHGAGYRVEVHDTGPGLSGAAFEQALLRNERLERDRDSADGTGLGLAVASETALSNDWRLTACAGRRDGATIRVEIGGF